MKRSSRPFILSGPIVSIAAACAAALFGGSAARAATYYWDSNGTAAGSGPATGTWGIDSFWNTDPTGGAGGSFTTATSSVDDLFLSAGANGTTGTVTINGAQAASSISFDDNIDITLSGGPSLTLGGSGASSGIFVSAGSVAIDFNVVMGAAQTWRNNSSDTLYFFGDSVTNGVNLLTVSGTGSTFIENAIGNGSGGLTKTGSGTLYLTGTNTYTGVTTVTGGRLNLGLIGPGSISASTAIVLSNNASLVLDNGTAGGALDRLRQLRRPWRWRGVYRNGRHGGPH